MIPNGEGSLKVTYDKKTNTYNAVKEYEVLQKKVDGESGYLSVQMEPQPYTGGDWQEFFQTEQLFFTDLQKYNQDIWNSGYGEEDYSKVREQINNQNYTNGGDIEWFTKKDEFISPTISGRRRKDY